MPNPDPAANCPFCGFKPEQGEYELLLHIDTDHPEDQSPFAASEGPVPCPFDGCGELVSPDELAYHLGLHELEAQGATPEPSEQPPMPPRPDSRRPDAKESRSSSKSNSRKHRSEKKVSAIQAWRDLFSGNSKSGRGREASSSRTRHKNKKSFSEGSGVSKNTDQRPSSLSEASKSAEQGERSREFARLGKSELGRFAHERRMPSWLVDLLEDQGHVANDGILPVLGQLLQQSTSTQYAYLCHSQVQHISKLRREGGFCGYRNIQMLVSHIIGAKTAGSEHFSHTFPSIFQIQDLIENAWDMGINAQGRVETGGVKGTRKYIGTPEAQAVFLSLQIPCSVQAFKDKERGRSKARLFEAVENYFQGGVKDVEDRIHLTDLPPIYLQHPGNFRDSTKIKSLVGKEVRDKPSSIDESLQPYRRGSHYFRKHSQYEVL
ncbi:Zinc finger with UFM1-specific peptidase domain [Fusarium albosuccineum]|uniref:Zinc finger with UFM1-specific peptidase domain n=1 Tax=Fusarium albosuccineum TaxID=1237068 RepID=A0A8H4LHU4_9HYPO|nr:Zinc finger with UFM1-specific peptidase domain [Fusarium albosuccineum]